MRSKKQKKRGKGKKRSVHARMLRKSVWRKIARGKMLQNKSEIKRMRNREHR